MQLGDLARKLINRVLGKTDVLFQARQPIAVVELFRLAATGGHDSCYSLGYSVPVMKTHVTIGVLVGLGMCSTAIAEPQSLDAILNAPISLTLHDDPQPPLDQNPSTAPDARPNPAESEYRSEGFTLFGPSHKRYGEAGSKAWTIGGLYANNFNEANDFNAHIAWSNFLADDLEFAVEAAGWYFDQSGQDTGGLSGSMIFRWHALHDDDYSWSVFFDAGIGLLGAFDEVPDQGTNFNFLPRLGTGATFALGDNRDGQAPRLMIGARWHHISNARIQGDSDNPARDSVAGYVGIVFPF